MKSQSIFIIGDSISIGYSPYLQKYLKEKFYFLQKKGIKESLWNHDTLMGANGGDSSLVLKYLNNNHIHQEIPKVDYFLFNCGLHDIKTNTISKKKQVSLSKYCKNLYAIIKKIKKNTNNIIWVNSTPINDINHNTKCKDFYRYNKDVLKYNNAAKKIMQKNNIPIIDLYSFTLKCGANLYTDHVHFRKKIYQKQGEYLAHYCLEKYNF